MNLGFETSEKTQLNAQSVSVLRRVSASFNPDESISFEGAICERKTIEGEIIDVNWKTAKSKYPGQDEMINLAAQTWTPSDEELAYLAEQFKQDKFKAVEVILSGFISISKSATQVILSQQEQQFNQAELDE